MSQGSTLLVITKPVKPKSASIGHTKYYNRRVNTKITFVSSSSSSRRPRLLPVKAWPYGRHIMIHDSFELLRERIASETIEGAPKSALQAGEVM